MRQLEKALKIRGNTMLNQKEANIKREIKDLYDNIKSHLEEGNIKDFNKPELYGDLKTALNMRKMTFSKASEEVHD